MTQAVAIVDYGMGNLRSVQNAINHLGYASVVVNDPTQLNDYRKIILPGVGAFGQAIDCLKKTGLADSLDQSRSSGAHILGICLGMQLMCKLSEEDGIHHGLGWFDAEVKRFSQASDLPVPHMGWNGVDFKRDDPVLKNIESSGDAYFVHSYHVVCKNTANILATTEYGIQFTSMICDENIRGIQFHPEKSQEFGLAMLRNYLELPC